MLLDTLTPISHNEVELMKIYLAPVDETELVTLLPARATLSTQHTIASDPVGADLVLFLGSFGTNPDRLLAHPIYQRWCDKSVVYTEDDTYLPLLPGIYCSARNDQNSRAGRTFSYSYVSRNGQYSNSFVNAALNSSKQFLFTFQGGSTSLLRKRLFNLHWNRPDILVENTSTYFHWDLTQPNRADRQLHYAKTLAASHFVLCPRGAGTGSIRLFEVMSAGVAPVLLSDHYLLPPHVDWSSFLLHIPEKDIARLPELLTAELPTSAQRGELARKAWQQHFSPECEWDAIINACVAALHHGPPSESTFRRRQRRMILRSRLQRSLRSTARTAVLSTLKALRLKSPYQLNR